MSLTKIIDSGYQIHIRQNEDGNMVFHAYPQSSFATKHIWVESKPGDQSIDETLLYLARQIDLLSKYKPKQMEIDLCLT